jgi:hypothetical protein
MKGNFWMREVGSAERANASGLFGGGAPTQFLVGAPSPKLVDNFDKRSSQLDFRWPAFQELNSFGTHTS